MQFDAINRIPVEYKTKCFGQSVDNLSVNFNLTFGQGKDSKDEPDYIARTTFNKSYIIEKFTNDGINMYRVLANEGVFVIRIEDINIEYFDENENYDYEYGIRFVVDLNNKPEYIRNNSTHPSNQIERDGNCWDLENGKSYNLDQNGNASYQWSTAKALSKGQKCTPEQEKMGIEERRENTGLIYITVIPIFKKKMKEESHNYRGGGPVYRGGGGPVYRGGSNKMRGSHAARVGYGSAASTKSSRSNYEVFDNGLYVLPIRLRIDKENYINNDGTSIKCAKNIEFAKTVEELQNSTGVMLDESSDEE